MSLDPAKALGNLPEGLRGELVTEYQKIARNYREHRWEAAELDGGRFSEIVYSILKGHVDGDYPERSKKPDDFPTACRRLDVKGFPKSVRIGLPKVIASLYDIRNNRGVGHVGGEVDANHMDAALVFHTVQWVMAELVRIFHDTDVVTATATVEALVDRTLPLIWEVDGVARVLDHKLPLRDRVLLLLYSSAEGVTDKSLMVSLAQTKLSNIKRVLKPLHDEVVINYREQEGWAKIGPKGNREVEDRLLPKTAI